MTTSNGRISLTFDQIAAAEDSDREWVPVKEWAPAGAPESDRDKYGVWVRSVSAAERERLMKASAVIEGRGRKARQRFDMPTFRVKLAAIAMEDEFGNRLMSERQVDVLGQKNARVVERISDVAVRLAGIEDDLSEDGDDETDGEETESAPGKSGNGFATTPSTAPVSSFAPSSGE